MEENEDENMNEDENGNGQNPDNTAAELLSHTWRHRPKLGNTLHHINMEISASLCNHLRRFSLARILNRIIECVFVFSYGSLFPPQNRKTNYIF